MALRDERKVRLPAVAGRFYDAEPLQLRRRLIDAEVRLPAMPTAARPVRAAILPHAGYEFALPTAMAVVRRLPREGIRRVVLLAPSHYCAFDGVALTGDEVLRTPFGDLSADRDAAARLLAEGGGLVAVNEEAHRREHALEVPLPLLQYRLGSFDLLPLVCGRLTPPQIGALAELLAPEWRADTLWVVSSDFTHFGQSFGFRPFRDDVAARLEALDRRGATLIADRDEAGFVRFLRETGATICGIPAILLLLAVLDEADEAGNIRGELVAYGSSGGRTGDWTHCVGYAGLVFA